MKLHQTFTFRLDSRLFDIESQLLCRIKAWALFGEYMEVKINIKELLKHEYSTVA